MVTKNPEPTTMNTVLQTITRGAIGGFLALALGGCLVIIALLGAWIIHTYEWGLPFLIIILVFSTGAFCAISARNSDK